MDYDQLADKYKPLNMGGFPDYIPCNYIGDVLSEVATGNHSVHQYTRAFVCSFIFLLEQIMLKIFVVGPFTISKCFIQIVFQIYWT